MSDTTNIFATPAVVPDLYRQLVMRRAIGEPWPGDEVTIDVAASALSLTTAEVAKHVATVRVFLDHRAYVARLRRAETAAKRTDALRFFQLVKLRRDVTYLMFKIHREAHGLIARLIDPIDV